MHGPIIDGDRWIAERLKFLRQRLEGDLSADERATIEAEIDVLTEERGMGPAGRRAGAIVRRIRRKA